MRRLNMRGRYFVVIIIILLIAVAPRVADAAVDEIQYNQDSLTVESLSFRIGSSVIDSEYKNNGVILGRIHSIFTDTTITNHIDLIDIRATSSPDGHYANNIQLAKKRAAAFKTYIERQYPYINSEKIYTHGHVESWNLLKSTLSPNVTYYNQIVDIIDQQLVPQSTELRLRAIDGGRVWGVIAKDYLPRMRSGAICVIYMSKTVIPTPESEPALELEIVPVVVPVVVQQITPIETMQKSARHPIFAIKTNLLYDALTAINLEVEVPIGERWSIAGEYIFPWWLSNKRQRCLQSLSGFIEGRYWFGDRTKRRQLTGWFAGVYAGGGYYDVEWNDKGYQGEFFIPFALSGGYAHSIGRNLSLEYSLGVGYMQTNYRKYNATLCSDGDMRLIKIKEDKDRWFGPTKMKVSLVWMINYRKGGAR